MDLPNTGLQTIGVRFLPTERGRCARTGSIVRVLHATPNEGYEGEVVIVDQGTEADILRMGQSTRL
jgi:hypothetical protein